MLKPIKFIPEETNIPFIRYRMMAIYGSGIAMVASILMFLIVGLNFGIDFKGGILVEMRASGAVEEGDARQALGELNLGDVVVQKLDRPTDLLVRVERQEGEGDDAVKNEEIQQDTLNKIKDTLRQTFGDDVLFQREETVGPKVSGELVVSGTIAVVLAVILVLIYIWLRFEWQFSLGAVMALVHDVVLTIGVFSLLQLEFTLSIIAALLTIVGYSLNDTVVVYDRVRENLRKFKKMPLEDLLTLSINQTLSRTIMTSVTTLLALIALYVFGGEVIRGFIFAMIWGVIVGTYSSIFIASPMLLWSGVKRDWSGIENKTVGA